MNVVLWHQHARKLQDKALEAFPSKNVSRRTFDYVMYGIGLLQPLALLPQIQAIYFERQTAGVSIQTWTLLAIFHVLWAMYGFAHGEKPIIVSSVFLAIFDAAIVVGALGWA